ncbi:ribokinase [Pisciglobus halotolerans]|uniref:Ribokinase n=1 Tax=Pisciglobus halotolerans TaxID=745365 RepID=A0A1I3AY01_9LACT|nr:ribokinase [Pisciglobus halotolerans]SFH54923.1 ribokinase [Pisciglobus halotolerans]
MSKIAVIGSISTDFVVTTAKRPEIGETITGIDFTTTYGGKGANQAIACARLGSEVQMIGAVGDDTFGEELIENLAQNRIDTQNVKRVTHLPSGSAHITLLNNDNAIIYIPGANDAVTVEGIDALENTLTACDLVLIQNETPQAVVEKVILTCAEKGIKLLYNPAPARVISPEWLEKVTYLTPNESEFQLMFPKWAVSEGVKQYPNKLFVTLGSKGVLYHDGTAERLVPSYKVQPVDTTGAGDTFNGAFAAAIAAGLPIEESVKFGNLAASLSIQKFGAQGGMPTLAEMKGSPNYEEKWDIE